MLDLHRIVAGVEEGRPVGVAHQERAVDGVAGVVQEAVPRAAEVRHDPHPGPAQIEPLVRAELPDVREAQARDGAAKVIVG